MKLYLDILPGIRVVLVGLGGTGGYVFYHLARLLASFPNRRVYQVVLADGDVVEEKNLVRQNFVRADLGKYKTECLARRYGNVYDLNFPYHTRFVEDAAVLTGLLTDPIGECIPRLSILVGCVDNNRTRQLFHQVFMDLKHPMVYLDSGNDEWSGQVLIGVRSDSRVLLPPVAHYYPDILADRDSLFPSEESCTQRAVSSPQNIATNVLAGTLAFGFLNQLLAGEGLTVYGATFNARTGQTRALYLDQVLHEKGRCYPFYWK